MAKQKDQIEKIKEELDALEQDSIAADSKPSSPELLAQMPEEAKEKELAALIAQQKELLANSKKDDQKKEESSFKVQFRAVQIDLSTDFESVSLESVETNRGSFSLINSLDKKGFFQTGKEYTITIK